MSEENADREYYLVQPWFSDAGHPSASLLRLSENFNEAKVFHQVLVYSVPKQHSAWQNEILKKLQATSFSAHALLQKLLGTLATGSMVTARHVCKLPKSAKIVYLDANLYVLSVALSIFRFRQHSIHVVLLQSPESYQAGWVGRLFKWPWVVRYMRRGNAHVILRTQELASAWREVFPKYSQRIHVIEHMDMLGQSIVENNTSPSAQHLDESRFLVAGQIRPEKSIERLLDVFKQYPKVGRLEVLGACRDARLLGLFHGLPSHIEVQNKYVSDVELAEAFERSDYQLMLYCDWDHRMESAMLYHSVLQGCPLICYQEGWLGRMVGEHRLGWIIKQGSLETIAEQLLSLPSPGEDAYLQRQENLRTFYEQYGSLVHMDQLLKVLDWERRS